MTRMFKRHEERASAPTLPPALAPCLRGYTFFRLVRNYPTVGEVFRAVKAGCPTLFLKVGTALGAELERLSWLDGKLPVPSVVAYSKVEKHDYLLLTRVPGLPADDKTWTSNPTQLMEKLADGLNTIHALSTTNCPFDASLGNLMTTATRIFHHQRLDPKRISRAYRHRTIDDLFKCLTRSRPATEHVVFTHGDLCLPNVLLQEKSAAGFVDWGSAGLSDPHRDLALLARSIRSNLGEKWPKLFLDLYGREVDRQKIEFYLLLDQFTQARCKQIAENVEEPI